MDALNLMGQFDIRSSSVLCCSSAEVPYAFRANPKVVYGKEEVAPRVYAVVEVFSVAFTQGVNEMQTLANLASSRDVLKQVDINQASLARMMEFYRNYREALDYQLTRRTPEMVDCLSMNTTAAGANPSISLPQKSIVRRKSYAQSFSGATNGNNGGPEPSGTINTAVEQLKSKVLSYNDR